VSRDPDGSPMALSPNEPHAVRMELTNPHQGPTQTSGKPWSGKRVVDRTGTLEEAVKRARGHASLPPDAPLVRVERKVSVLDLLLGRVQRPITISTPRKPLSVEVLLIWPLPLELDTIITRVTANS